MMQQPTHGAIDYAELKQHGLDPSQICDFSSNVNPLGTPDFIRAALATVDLAHYPDRQCLALRAALANHHTCAPEQLLIGNGSNELIHLIARALLQANDYVVLIEPTFGEYAYASSLAGAQLIRYQASAKTGFQVDVAACCQLIAEYRPRLVWLCNPNNPTGSYLPAQAIEQLQAACATVQGYLVLDLAYADLGVGGQGSGVGGWELNDSIELNSPRPLRGRRVGGEGTQPNLQSPAPNPHTIYLYSLTKSYALAGLRLGYVVAKPNIITALRRWQPQWSVNSLAQAAGLAIMANSTWLAQQLGQWWAWSDQLRAELGQLGLRVLPSCLPFFLVEVQNAAQTRSALLQHACLVRDCSSFGLPSLIRIAPRQPHQNQRLLAAWRTLCSPLF
ncbi:pyridoxal phosphate-dependent aminotransferase [Herpetosiphon giganteus]|uniref:pyridoxal phosphate-dependent aminotransferase n=1 Tax=Herpetosiphon giganteus TaxID=2029754 RepID=UPI00195AE63C|nr:histidinol-phosphate transaminase [Herpetosiphon giganteus]MBM7842976.1 threonine-phosphate decarboxylase [Herpetosiphon giganteus]